MVNAPQPGQHFILRRPYGGKDEPDRFYLVEIGTRKPPRPYTSDWPADQIEILVRAKLSDPQDIDSIVSLYDPPASHFTAPGVVLDRRFYTPIRVEKDVKSGRCAASQRRSGLLRTEPVPVSALREPAANARCGR